MQVVVKEINGFDVHQDAVSGEVLRVVSRAEQPRTDFESMTDDEKAAHYEAAKKSTRPLTLGEHLTATDMMRDFVIERFNKLAAKLNEHTDRIEELDRRPIPKFFAVPKLED